MNNNLEYISEFDFTYTLPSSVDRNPFLFHAERAGCSCCESDFEISRDKDYPFYTIHSVLSGCGFFHIAGQNHFLTKGDIFIITPGQAHNYCNFTSASLGMLWAEISGMFCHELFSSIKNNAVYTLHHQENEALTDCLRDLVYYHKDNAIPNPYEASAKIYRLFMYLLEAADSSLIPKRPVLLTDAFNYIHEHFSESLQVQDIANTLHISSTYLNKLFHRYTGTSTIQYITRKRVAYACSLLANTNLTCEAISEKSGLCDASYLNRIFKSVTGLSPTQYRKNIRGNT